MLIPGLPLRLIYSGTVHMRPDCTQIIKRRWTLTGPTGVRSWLQIPIWQRTTIVPSPWGNKP